jgi:predicted transcriptional regulator
VNDITKMVFQQTKDGLAGKGSGLDITLLNIVLAMDGHRSVTEIAEEDSYDLKDLSEKVQTLLTMGVIEAATNANELLSDNVMEVISKQMANYTGPVANILVENCAKSLGHTTSMFPSYLLEKLLELLSAEIEEEKDAQAFRQSIRVALVNK